MSLAVRSRFVLASFSSLTSSSSSRLRAFASRTPLRLHAVPRALASSSSSKGSSSSSSSYTERMEKTGRPVSPHVSIYAFPATALTSIANRVCGVLLTVGLSGIGAAALVGADVGAAMTIVGGSMVGPLAKIAVAFPLSYHFVGGVRHFIWDHYPQYLVNEDAKQASYAVVGASAAITLLAAMI